MTLETLPANSVELVSGTYHALEYDKNPTTWEKIKEDVLALHRGSFPEIEDLEEKLQRGFNGADTTAILLYDTSAGEPKKLIGYTFALPILHLDRIQHRHIPTAGVDTTVIEEGYRNQGLVGLLMLQLEEVLRSKGYEQMERSVVTHNGYAEAVKRHYGQRGRILQEPQSLRKDRQKFLIRL